MASCRLEATMARALGRDFFPTTVVPVWRTERMEVYSGLAASLAIAASRVEATAVPDLGLPSAPSARNANVWFFFVGATAVVVKGGSGGGRVAAAAGPGRSDTGQHA